MKNTENTTSRTAPINHRPEEEAARKAVFADDVYTLSKKVVFAKAKGARLRGISNDKNVYLMQFEDMIQEAAKALQEAEAEQMQYTVTTPPECEQDYFIEHDTPFLSALKACGRLESWFSVRAAKESTPIEHISEHATTSAQERDITEREALKDWTARAIDAVRMYERTKSITARQAENMLHLIRGHAERVTKPSYARAHLLKVLKEAGLLEKDSTGKLVLQHD